MTKNRKNATTGQPGAKASVLGTEREAENDTPNTP